MFESSAIPAAIDALVGMCTDQTVVGGTLEGITVYDGWYVIAPSDETFLSIAVPADVGAAGVDGTQDWITMPGREKDEHFSIFCEAVSRSGNKVMKAERDRAFGMVAAVERMIRPGVPNSDVELRGTVQWAQVTGRIAFTPLQTSDGAAARVQFEVACRARLSAA
jgi:hypothetical protein